jgi:MATE family multidrug resistance protein
MQLRTILRAIRPELRELARLSLPIAIAQFGWVAMGLVDTAIVGHVSTGDLAGTALGRALGFGSASFAIGAGMALEPLASQALGAREEGRAWSALGAVTKSVLLVSVPATLAAFAATLLFEPFGMSRDVVLRARAYLAGQAPGLPLIGVFVAGKSFLQAHGRTRPALVASMVANVLNAGVCFALVQRYGALGAGLANSVAQLVLTAIVFHAARALRPESASGADSVSLSKALRVGLPVGAQIAAEAGVFATVTLLAARLGTDAVSAHQIALGLASFSYMGALGVSGATAVRVGRAVGAGESPRKAGSLGILLGAAVMGVSATIFACFPGPLVATFTPDQGVRALGVTLLLVAAALQLFDGVQCVASGALRGVGDVRFPFLINVVAYYGLGLPVAFFLAFVLDWGPRGLWWGLTCGLVASSVTLAARFSAISRAAVARV